MIKRGDWYTLNDAIKKIESHSFNMQKENRLIKELKLINKCRSLAKAKASYQDQELESFKRTLKDLSKLGINPVTIPKEWGVRCIPNLLYAYYDKLQDEIINKQYDEWLNDNSNDYIKEYGFPN